VTEPIEVAEEPVTKVVNKNGDSRSNNKVAYEKGQWVLVAKQSGRESKAIMKNVGCARVQSHNWRVSEVSCENCTHMAIAAKKIILCKGCYTQRDSGGVWTTPEMSGQGSHHGYWDSKGMYEDENIVVI